MRFKRTFMSVVAGVLALAAVLVTGTAAQADSVEVKPYLAFGADLTSS